MSSGCCIASGWQGRHGSVFTKQNHSHSLCVQWTAGWRAPNGFPLGVLHPSLDFPHPRYSHTVGATVCPEKRLSNKEPSEIITHQNSNYLTRLPPSVSFALEAARGSPLALDSLASSKAASMRSRANRKVSPPFTAPL